MLSIILLALIPYFGWGVGDIFGTIASRKLDAYSVTFWRIIMGTLFSALYIPFAMAELRGLTLQLVFVNIILGIILYIGLVSLYEGVRIANPALVGTIAASFVVLTVILSVIFFGERLSLYQAIGVLIIFIGVFITSLNFQELRRRKISLWSKGIIFGFVAMFCWGIYFTFIKILTKEIGWFWPAFISPLSALPFLLLFMKKRNLKLETIDSRSIWAVLFINSILLVTGDFGYNLAINRGFTTIAAPIAGSYPTIFVFLAFLIFKDPLSRQQIVGIVASVIGIVILSLFSA